jgi:hypothetical protein
MYRRNRVLPLVNDLGIPIVDMCTAFAVYDDPFSFYPNRLKGHYNEKGYRLVAETVLQFIEERKNLAALQAWPNPNSFEPTASTNFYCR